MQGNALKIEIKNLSLSYGEKVLFKLLNIPIKEHAITAIVGPSGIGKSSLLQVINQMIREYEEAEVTGEVLFYENQNVINVKDLRESELCSYRQKVLHVSQHPDILPFSIFDNMAFGLRLQGLNKHAIETKVSEALKRVYLWDEVKERLHVKAELLSGGQQQRLILARALCLNPQVLLLDEPTASLNEGLSQKIESLLIELKKEMTIVIISHFKEQVKRIADAIYELE